MSDQSSFLDAIESLMVEQSAVVPRTSTAGDPKSE
jgi:hypothetical protein